MPEFVAIAGIIGALAVGVVSPGPSFVMVARVAVAATSRANGVCAAVGMGVGGVVFAVAALFGLQAILLAVPAVYLVLKLLGGLYLCYLGVRIFLGAKVRCRWTVPGQSVGTLRARSFWLGLTTQVSNPKAAIVYGSVFVAFLHGTFSPLFAAVLLLRGLRYRGRLVCGCRRGALVVPAAARVSELTKLGSIGRPTLSWWAWV